MWCVCPSRSLNRSLGVGVSPRLREDMLRCRSLVLWRGQRFMAVDRDGAGYAVAADCGSGRLPSWEAVQRLCLVEGWRPALVVYEPAA